MDRFLEGEKDRALQEMLDRDEAAYHNNKTLNAVEHDSRMKDLVQLEKELEKREKAASKLMGKAEVLKEAYHNKRKVLDKAVSELS